MKRTKLFFAFSLLTSLLACQESFDESPVELQNPESTTINPDHNTGAYIINPQQEYKPGRTIVTRTKYNPVIPREWGLHEYRLVLYKDGIRIRELTEANVEQALYWQAEWTIPSGTPYGDNYQLGYVYVDFNRGGAKYYSKLSQSFSIVDQEGCWMKVTELKKQYTEGEVLSTRALTISRGVSRTVKVEFTQYNRLVNSQIRPLHQSPYNAQPGQTYFADFNVVLNEAFTPGNYTMRVTLECGGGFESILTQHFEVIESSLSGDAFLIDALF